MMGLQAKNTPYRSSVLVITRDLGVSRRVVKVADLRVRRFVDRE